MAIEREVRIQLKVERPKDGAAFADAARQAKELSKAFGDIGGSGGGKAIADVATAASHAQTEAKGAAAAVGGLVKELGLVSMKGINGKAFLDASASAQAMSAETRRGKDAVTSLARELGRSSKEAAAIDKLSAQLRALGTSADAAKAAATKMTAAIGAGAKLAERDVQRLATAIKATGGGAGSIWTRPMFAGGGGIGGMSVGQIGAMVGGAQALQVGGQVVSENLAYSQEVQDLARRDSPGWAGVNRFARSLPVLGAVAGAGADMVGGTEWLPSWLGGAPRSGGSREGVEESQRALQSQPATLARQRQLNVMRAQATLSRQAVESTAENATDLAESTIRGGRITARERVQTFQSDRRFEQIGQQQAREFESQARGEGLGRGSLVALQREIQTPQAFGGAAREQIAAERANAQREIQAAQATRDSAATAGAGGNEAMRIAAAEQLRTARERLLDIERRDVDLTRQAAEAEQQRLERFRQFAVQAEESYRRIAQAERDRISSFREQFGLMNEIERANIAMVAQRAAQNGGRGIQGLANDELRQLQGTGLFQEQVRGEAVRRAELSGVQGIIQASGAENRVRQAEARQQEAAQIAVALNNQITNNITISAEATGRQIADQVMPAIRRVMEAAIAQINERFEDQMNVINSNAMANAPTG